MSINQFQRSRLTYGLSDRSPVNILKHIFSQTIGSIELKFHPKGSKGVKIRNRYNQVPHLTQDSSGTVTNSKLDTTNESEEVSLFPADDHKAHIKRRPTKA